MENTSISWTDNTFNVVLGCTKISEGCKFCYALLVAKRMGLDVWGPEKPRKVLSKDYWERPYKWNRRAKSSGRRERVFCSSMADVFEDHPTVDQERERLWPVIKATPFLDLLILTKRPDRIQANLPADWGEGYPNVWLGVSIENENWVSRADHLRIIPAVVRFVSYEPALGLLDRLNLKGLDWLIYGGEVAVGRTIPTFVPKTSNGQEICETGAGRRELRSFTNNRLTQSRDVA